jgi:hypothetical protein
MNPCDPYGLREIESIGTDLKNRSDRKNLLDNPPEHGHLRKACEPVIQVQPFVFSGGSDPVSSKPLDPPAHSLVSVRFEK